MSQGRRDVTRQKAGRAPTWNRTAVLIAVASGVVMLVLAFAFVLADRGGGDQWTDGKVRPPSSEYDLDADIRSTNVPAEEEEKIPVVGANAKSVETVLAVSVFDEDTGQLVPQFNMKLWCQSESNDPDVINRSVKEATSPIQITLPREGLYRVLINAPGYLPPPRRLEVHVRPQTCTSLEVTLSQGGMISGIVLEEPSENPIEGAQVTAKFIYSDEVWDGKRYLSLGGTRGSDITDSSGQFRIIGLDYGEYFVKAVRPGYGGESVKVITGTSDVELRLRVGYRVHGTALNDVGDPATEAMVELSDPVMVLKRVGVATDGTYDLGYVPPGHYTIVADQRSGKLLTTFTKEYREIEVRDSDVEVDFGPRPDFLEWRGTLYGYDGNPVSYGLIYLDSVRGDDVRQVTRRATDKTALCNEDGEFVVRKLTCGTYDLNWYYRGDFRTELLLGFDRPAERITLDGYGTLVRDVHMPRTAVLVRLVDEKTGRPTVEDNARVSIRSRKFSFRRFPTKSDCSFLLRGLPPDTYWIEAAGSNFSHTNTVEVDVLEGVTKNVDLVVPSSGTLVLYISGLGQFEGEKFGEYKLRRTDGEEAMDLGCSNPIARGELTSRLPLRIGGWCVTLSHPEIGKTVQSFDILSSQTTRLELTNADFEMELE